MLKILMLMVELLNKVHHLILKIVDDLGLPLTDKQLHFWVLGIIGIFLFVLADAVFRRLAKWSVSAISFIYTFTVMVTFILAIEIQQKITRAGNMEFQDVVAGLSGFLAIFTLYILIKFIISHIKKMMDKQ